MTTEPEDIKLVVAELLALEWDETNVDNVGAVDTDLRIGTGWRDSGLDMAQVTVGPDDDSPTTGTGYDGIKPDGSGPTATIRGTVEVNTWVTPTAISASSQGVAKQAAKQLADEVHRIVQTFYEVANYDFAGNGSTRVANADVAAYEYLAWFGKSWRPDPESEDEVVQRYRCVVRYEYHDVP